MKPFVAPLAVLALLLAGTDSVLAETLVPIYEGTNLAAEAKLSSCSTGCSKQMGVTARHIFVFDGDYSRLYSELENVSLKVTAYDDGWADSESGNVTFKVSSTVHAAQRWRRTNLARRKIEQVADTAVAIFAVAAPGQVVTLEFQQDPQPLTGTDFTVNVKQYRADAIMESRSRAVTPDYFVPGSGAGGEGHTVNP